MSSFEHTESPAIYGFSILWFYHFPDRVSLCCNELANAHLFCHSVVVALFFLPHLNNTCLCLTSNYQLKLQCTNITVTYTADIVNTTEPVLYVGLLSLLLTLLLMLLVLPLALSPCYCQSYSHYIYYY